MNGSVLRSRQRDKVLNAVVQGVVVDVVDHRAASAGAVHGFPRHDGALAPDVRFGHLHEGPPITVPLVAGADSDRPNREMVVSDHTLRELGARRVASALVHAVQRVVERGRASTRAAVGGTQFGGLARERRTADRACEGDGHGLIVSPFAGTGTTGAVADLHGRDAIGIDIDPRNPLLYDARCAECARNLLGSPIPDPAQLDLFGAAS